MTWDAADRYVLLFGGRDGTTDFNDTWTFNGTAWTQINTTVAPPPMTSGRIAYDAADGYVWMYGGYSIMAGAPASYNATWTYKAGSWTNITANVSGAPPDPHAVTYAAYDASDGYVLLYGSTSNPVNVTCTVAGNTWTYLHGNYTNLTATLTAAPPLAQGSRMMGEDPVFGGVILYGGWDGAGCAYSSETWLFHGGNWTQLNLSYDPGGTWDAAFAADTGHDALLLFGGDTGAGQSSQTWNFSPAFAVAWGANRTEGVAPYSVHFNASVLALAPIAINWSFGDGSPNATNASTNHTFAVAGTYTVHLLIRDGLGRERLWVLAVHAYSPLSGSTLVLPRQGDAPLLATFNASVVGGVPPRSYRWSFGDGASSTSANVTHTYLLAGHLTWYLNVTDAQGHVLGFSGPIDVGPTLLLTGFSPSKLAGIAPFAVPFSVTPTGGVPAYTVTWSFGDGSPDAIGATADHTYLQTGTFHGNVTVRDTYGGVAMQLFTVKVANPLAGNAILVPTAGVAPLLVVATTAPTGGFPPYAYLWEFGTAGATATTEVASYSYTAAGSYTGNVTVTDSQGNTAETNFTVLVVTPLTVSLASDRTAGDAPWTFNFTATAHGGRGPYNISWEFGDGARSMGGTTAAHTFTAAGLYQINVTVGDQVGQNLSSSVTVSVARALAVGLSANATSVPEFGAVRLTATATGGTTPLRATWTGLPAGCSSSSGEFVYLCVPSEAGTFHITVWVNDSTGRGRVASTDLTVTPAAAPSTNSAGGGGSLPWLLIGVIVGVVAVALAVTAWWWSRRPDRQPPAPAPESGEAGADLGAPPP
jgi:PKD repeat protein